MIMYARAGQHLKYSSSFLYFEYSREESKYWVYTSKFLVHVCIVDFWLGAWCGVSVDVSLFYSINVLIYHLSELFNDRIVKNNYPKNVYWKKRYENKGIPLSQFFFFN